MARCGSAEDEAHDHRSVIKIVNLGFYAGDPRADSTVLCHVITHGDGAISLMNITHLLASLSEAKVINEAEISPH